jgi:integrase
MTHKRGWHEGTIYRRENGAWRAQITINGRNVSHTAKTRAECMTWIQKTRAQPDQAIEPPESFETIGEYLESWLESVKTTLRPKTAIQYEQIIQHHIIPFIGKMRLKDLRPILVDQFYGKLLKDGIGVRTIRLTHSVLHVAFERAVKYELIFRNPAHGAQVPKKNTAEMSVLDESQVSTFLTAAQGSRYQVLFHLAIVTGMRQAELFGLKWADISWTKGQLYVRRQAQRIPGQGCVLSEPKTKAGRRTIKLGEGTLNLLRQQSEKVAQNKAVAGRRWIDYDLIFPCSIGTPLDQSNVLGEFYMVLENAGLPKIRFHDLRHTAASLMLNHGVPVIVVSKILGHSKPSVTVDIYGHLYNEMQDQAAQIMDDLVTPVPVELTKSQGEELLKNPADKKLHQITPESPEKVLKTA